MPVYNFPTGTIIPHASIETPKNWVRCDGSTYDGNDSRYLNLWSVLGTTYGGTGQSSFKVPSLGSRVPVGVKPSATSVTNSSFATNTTGWTAGSQGNQTSGSVITRDTSVFDTSPASGRWDNTGASNGVDFGDVLVGTFSGTFTAGVTYKLSVRIKGGGTGTRWLYAGFGVVNYSVSLNQTSGNFAFYNWNGFSNTDFLTYTAYWIPSSTVSSGVNLVLNDRSAFFGGSGYYWIDSVSLSSSDGDGGLGTWYGGTTHTLTPSQTGVQSHNHSTSGTGYHDHGGNWSGNYNTHTHTMPLRSMTYENKNTDQSRSVYGGSQAWYTEYANIPQPGPTWFVGSAYSGGASFNISVTSTTAANAASSHTNIQPEMAFNYIIKL